MIADNLLRIQNENPQSVQLVVVSKTRSQAEIMQAYETGHRVFGENRVPEMVEKSEVLPQDIQWHMIGHLQTNKVKYIAPFVSLIHSVDSLKLLKEINKRARQNDRVIDCLLQFHIARESEKFGLDLSETGFLGEKPFRDMQHVRICGVMGMATFTEDENIIRSEFKSLREIFEKLQSDVFNENPTFREISMGMSGDYKLAIEEGSTMVRIGSHIFGPRE